MTEEGWFSSILSRFIKATPSTEPPLHEQTNKNHKEKSRIFLSHIEDNEIISKQIFGTQHQQYLWNKNNFVKGIDSGSGTNTLGFVPVTNVQGSISGTKGQESISGAKGQRSISGTKGQGSISGTNGKGSISGTKGQGSISGTKGQGSISGSKGQGSISGSKGQGSISGTNGQGSISSTKAPGSLAGKNLRTKDKMESNKREKLEKENSQEHLVSPHKKLTRSMSVSNEGRIVSMFGLPNRSTTVKTIPRPRPASAFSRISVPSEPFTRSPVFATPSFTLPAQVEEQSLKTSIRRISVSSGRRHSQPLLFKRPLSSPSSGPSRAPYGSTRPTSASARPPLGPSRPLSGPSRPTSGSSSDKRAISHLHKTVPIWDRDSGDYEPVMISSKKVFQVASVSPIYERARAAPTPLSSSDYSTPILEAEGERRVRFLESEVVGEGSRPSSAVSMYSNILKNSSRFSFTSNEAREIYGVIGHSPRICNCPCHFFPKVKQNIGVQVLRSDLESMRPPRPPPRPRHYRLFVIPTLAGLGNLSSSSKLTALIVRILLSQVGLGIVIVMWWFIGALIFSTIERPLQYGHLERMSTIKKNLAIDLATELRQVVPHDPIWRSKIEDYMIKLETAVLQAVKAGYTSNTLTWSIPESFLYSFSLTALLGPGGLVLQSPLTRIFSIIYSFVGFPIFLILLFNVAQTLREGLTLIWIWRRRRKRVDAASQNDISRPTNSVDNQRPNNSLGIIRPSNALGLVVNTNTIEVGATRIERPTFSRDFAQLVHISKVQVLDSNLPCSRPGSSVSRDVFYENVPTLQTTADPEAGTSSALSAAKASPIHFEPSSNNAQPTITRVPIHNESPVNPQPMPNNLTKRPSKDSVPWFILVILPTVYFALGTTLLVTTQNWTLVSALFVMGNNLMLIDHGGIDNKRLFNSGTAIFLYTISVLVGVIISLTFVLGIWPKIKAALGEAGRSLYVVKPLYLTG